ncbi:MAG: hypothetical protein ACYSWU_17965 [Planctomycetota bacterium]
MRTIKIRVASNDDFQIYEHTFQPTEPQWVVMCRKCRERLYSTEDRNYAIKVAAEWHVDDDFHRTCGPVAIEPEAV